MSNSQHFAFNTSLISYAPELLDAIPSGIIITSRDGLIHYINAEGSRLFGYISAELLQQPIETLLPERFKANHGNLRASYTENPSTRYMGVGRDLFGKRKDGSEFPVEIGLRPLETTDQTFYIASIVDISKRKRAEDLFAQVIEASPFGQLLVDYQGIIQLVNSRFLDLFGYTREELIEKPMELLLPERYREDHFGHRAHYQGNPSLRAMGVGRDLTGLHKNGTEFPIEIGLSAVETDDGKFVLAAITDITERKRLELSLKQANSHLEEFTYVASHDLKSPLRGISDLIEWIIEDCDKNTPESMLKNIDRVKTRIGRMEHLIEDLLRYARAGKRSGESQIINVKELIDNIIDMHPVPEHFTLNVNIQINFIQAAKTPLETVLRNLFSNAIKHHDGVSPAIEISASAAGNYCLFSISDNGIGIPESAKDRVFRLFQTLSATERAGSGLGLALAKRLTESHGGQISLESKDGKRGSTFHVKWPRFPRRDIDE